jgi:hypothetical protein
MANKVSFANVKTPSVVFARMIVSAKKGRTTWSELLMSSKSGSGKKVGNASDMEIAESKPSACVIC